MSDKNQDGNDRSLKAWNLWKEKCSVANLRGDTPEERVAVSQKYSDRELLDLQKKLSFEIRNAFENKFASVLGKETQLFYTVMSRYKNESYSEEDKKNSSEKETEQKSDEFKDLLHWSHEFDCGVINTNVPKKAQAVLGKKKGYKDFLWAKIAESNDSPLRVIRGKLLGPLGIINDIAERYLRENHYEIWANYNEYKNNQNRKNPLENTGDIHISIHQPIKNGDDSCMEEIIADPDNNDPSYFCQLKEHKKDLLETFSLREMAFILAKLGNMLDDPDFQQYVNLKKTAVYAHWNKYCLKLKKHIDLLSVPGTFEIMKKILIESEKTQKTFLLKLSKRIK